MQDNQLDRLVDMAFQERELSKNKVQSKIKSIESKNNKSLSDLPNYERTPTAEELNKFREYAIAYNKQIPGASKREVRKAIQEQFNIRIYK